MSDEDGSAIERVIPLREEGGRPIVPPRVIQRMRVIAEAIFATEAGPPAASRLDWLAAEMEDFLARSGARTRFVVGSAVLGVWLLAPLLAGRVRSLGSLPLRERAHALANMEHRFGGPVLAVKALLCVHYYEHPDVAREIGFDAESLVARQLRVHGS